MCLPVVNMEWNGVSQSLKCIFCNCNRLLLSMLGFAKLRMAVLSREIAETWDTGMACTLNLIQKNCSELSFQLGTSMQQGTHSYGKGPSVYWEAEVDRMLVRGHAGDLGHDACQLRVLEGPCKQRQEVWEMGAGLPKYFMRQLPESVAVMGLGPVAQWAWVWTSMIFVDRRNVTSGVSGQSYLQINLGNLGF